VSFEQNNVAPFLDLLIPVEGITRVIWHIVAPQSAHMGMGEKNSGDFTALVIGSLFAFLALGIR
jgi:hypothetical protein